MKNKFIKKIFSIALVCVLAIQMVGCGNSNNKIDMTKLEKTMMAADVDMPTMLAVNSDSDNTKDLFAYLSDMDYSKVDKYFLDYAQEGTAEEVAVIKVKNSKDVDEAKKSLEKHIQDRIAFYKSYDPTQVDRANDAQIFVKDDYAVLIVSDNASEIKKAFEDSFK